MTGGRRQGKRGTEGKARFGKNKRERESGGEQGDSVFRSGKQRCIAPEGEPFSRLDPACLPRLIYNFHRAPAPPLVYDCPDQFVGRVSKLPPPFEISSLNLILSLRKDSDPRRNDGKNSPLARDDTVHGGGEFRISREEFPPFS